MDEDEWDGTTGTNNEEFGIANDQSADIPFYDRLNYRATRSYFKVVAQGLTPEILQLKKSLVKPPPVNLRRLESRRELGLWELPTGAQEGWGPSGAVNCPANYYVGWSLFKDFNVKLSM